MDQKTECDMNLIEIIFKIDFSAQLNHKIVGMGPRYGHY